MFAGNVETTHTVEKMIFRFADLWMRRWCWLVEPVTERWKWWQWLRVLFGEEDQVYGITLLVKITRDFLGWVVWGEREAALFFQTWLCTSPYLVNHFAFLDRKFCAINHFPLSICECYPSVYLFVYIMFLYTGFTVSRFWFIAWLLELILIHSLVSEMVPVLFFGNDYFTPE